jgi:capsular exopolysaccharide synthesis family protein
MDMLTPEPAARQASVSPGRRRIASESWTLGTIVAIVVRRIGFVLAMIAGIAAAALVYVILTESRFTATALLVPDMKRAPTAPNEVTQETLIDPAIVENQIETIKSRKIALTVIDKLSLWKDPEFVKPPGAVARALAGAGVLGPLTEPDTEIKRSAAAASFAGMLKVFRVGRSYLTEISFTSVDPAKAASIANEIAEAYIQDQLGAKLANAERSSRWMHQRIAELQQQSTAAAEAIEDYKTRNNLKFEPNVKPALLREHEELVGALQRARADSAQANARVERIEATLRAEDRNALPDAGFLEDTNDPTITRLRDNYRIMAGDLPLRPLEDRGQPADDPDLAARLTQQRNAIWDAVHAVSGAAKKELEAAHLREASIVRRIKETEPRVDAIRKHFHKLKELDAQHQDLRQRHDALQNRFTRVSQFVQQQSLPVTEARIVTEATPPLKKSSPKTSIILLLATCAGLLFGVGGAIGREYFDRAVRRPAQLDQELGLRSLGMVPRFDRRAGARNRSHRNERAHNHFALTSHSPLVRRVAHWVSGPAGETLRGVKVAVDDDLRSSSGRVLAVVSPNPGEGKTTVALALATLAARGKRTLLIDADIREPFLTRALTPDAEGGFAERLVHRAPVIDADARHELGFYFLGQAPGFTAAHPSDLLASDAMQDLLEQLRGRYDYIIVDTPAMKPCVDVVAAAHLFDCFVLIAEWGRTTTDDIEWALTSSRTLAERNTGVLINKGPMSATRFKRAST